MVSHQCCGQLKQTVRSPEKKQTRKPTAVLCSCHCLAQFMTRSHEKVLVFSRNEFSPNSSGTACNGLFTRHYDEFNPFACCSSPFTMMASVFSLPVVIYLFTSAGYLFAVSNQRLALGTPHRITPTRPITSAHRWRRQIKSKLETTGINRNSNARES